MARLTEAEKAQLLRPLQRQPTPPAPGRLTPFRYIEFASFASRFTRTIKPVRFEGKSWKL